MSERYTVIPRTMCLVFCQDEILLIKASEKKDYPGIYDPIGGHIEKGEDVLESANREIKEESGFEVTDTKLKGIIHVNNFFGKNIIMFVTSSIVPSKIVPPIHEEGIPEWVPIASLDKLKIFEDLKPIIDTVIHLKDGEFFTGINEFDDSGKLIKLDIKVI